VKKKAEPTNQNISAEWKSRLERMRKYQDEFASDWSSNEKLLYGDTTGVSADGLQPGVGQKSKGLAYAWGLVGGLLSEIYVQNPTVVAEPLWQGLYQHGRVLTRVLQTDMEQMDAETVVQQCIVDCFTHGYGVAIEALENYISVRVDDESQEEAPLLEGQDFTLRRVHPVDQFFDPSGRLHDLSDHRYVATRFYPTIGWLREEAKKQGFTLPEKLDEFPESAKETRGGSTMEMTLSAMGSNPSEEKDPGYKNIAVFEIHDRLAKKITYVIEHGKHEIGSIPWPVDLKIGSRCFFPHSLLAFHRRSSGFYPTPELSFIRPQLVELANLDRMMRMDAGSKFRKIATMAEFIDPMQRAQIADMTQENALISLDRRAVEEFFGEENIGRDFDIRRVVAVLDDIQVNRDHPMRYQMIEAQIHHILGYGPSERGGMPKVRSAREALIVNDSLQQKLHIRRSAVERFFRQICQKHTIFLQTLQETERYARNFPEVVELQPFFSYTKDQIKGEFAFRIYAGSSAPLNTDARKAMVREMFQLMAPVLQQQGIDLRPLVEMVGKAHGWDEVDRLFNNVRGELKALAAVLYAVQTGQAQPQSLLEAAARVVQTGLSQAELQLLAQQMQQQQGPGGQVPQEKPGLMRGDPDAMGTGAGVI
jgi:hypothetical protein